MSSVSQILDDIQIRGLDAALEYTKQFDGAVVSPSQVLWDPTAVPPVTLPQAEIPELLLWCTNAPDWQSAEHWMP